MSLSSKPLVRTLSGEKRVSPPFWFMRQAGRYLPEYKELRSKAKNFLDFCYTPDMAAEATLQPIRRFGMDGAIIFSDILVIPHAMGMDVRFEEGVGPVLAPVRSTRELEGLSFNPDRLSNVYEAIRMTSQALPGQTAMIGFAGAPWTLACYMIQGKGSRDFQQVRSLAVKDRVFFTSLVDRLVDAVADHAIRQIEAGAEVIQLFDSWSGVLCEIEFNRWVIEPTCRIVENIRAAYPSVPITGFPRLAGSKYADYAKATKVNAVNIDGSVSLAWAANTLGGQCVLQGNLDPVLLAEDGQAALAETKRIVSLLGDKPFVFNLGHGILPHTPIANVQLICDFIKEKASLS